MHSFFTTTGIDTYGAECNLFDHASQNAKINNYALIRGRGVLKVNYKRNFTVNIMQGSALHTAYPKTETSICEKNVDTTMVVKIPVNSQSIDIAMESFSVFLLNATLKTIDETVKVIGSNGSIKVKETLSAKASDVKKNDDGKLYCINSPGNVVRMEYVL